MPCTARPPASEAQALEDDHQATGSSVAPHGERANPSPVRKVDVSEFADFFDWFRGRPDA